MMIRAGVDDRGMLAASGVNVNLVFAITFAIGAGLAGFGGVIGAVELSMVPGEDTRLLLASLIVVIVGGMGSVVGAAIGAAILGLAETYRARVCADVQRRVHVPDPRAGAGVSAAWNSREAGMSAAELAQGDELRRRPDRDGGRASIGRRCSGARRRSPVDRRRGSIRRAGFPPVRQLCARAHVVVLALLLVYPFVATPFFTFQIAAQSLALGMIALSLAFLGGYGGMISLAQMTVAGIAGYLVAILGTSGTRGDQPQLAVVDRGAAGALRSRRCAPRSSAGCRCAPKASTRS